VEVFFSPCRFHTRIYKNILDAAIAVATTYVCCDCYKQHVACHSLSAAGQPPKSLQSMRPSSGRTSSSSKRTSLSSALNHSAFPFTSTPASVHERKIAKRRKATRRWWTLLSDDSDTRSRQVRTAMQREDDKTEMAIFHAECLYLVPSGRDGAGSWVVADVEVTTEGIVVRSHSSNTSLNRIAAKSIRCIEVQGCVAEGQKLGCSQSKLDRLKVVDQLRCVCRSRHTNNFTKGVA